MPIKVNARACPYRFAMGRTAKFPTNPPILIEVATNVASSSENEPVGNVVFSCCSSMKLIVPHPVEFPYENASKLTIYNGNSKLFLYSRNLSNLLTTCTYCRIYLQHATARNWRITGVILHMFHEYAHTHLVPLNDRWEIHG